MISVVVNNPVHSSGHGIALASLKRIVVGWRSTSLVPDHIYLAQKRSHQVRVLFSVVTRKKRLTVVVQDIELLIGSRATKTFIELRSKS